MLFKGFSRFFWVFSMRFLCFYCFFFSRVFYMVIVFVFLDVVFLGSPPFFVLGLSSLFSFQGFLVFASRAF